MLETKIDIRKTALIVIDMQNDLVKTEEEPLNSVTKMVKSKGVINNIAKVIAVARRAAMPIIFTNHIHRKDGADVIPTITDLMLQGLASPFREATVEGTPGADIVDELKPASRDHVIWKRRSNAFYNTDLELMLRTQAIDTVILTGVVTNGCIANTARGARERDLHVIILSDCCATMTIEDDDFFITKIFPREGQVRTSDEMAAVIAEADAQSIAT